MLNKSDIEQIEQKGLTAQIVEKQIQNFKDGFPFLNIEKAATIDDGITRLTPKEVEAFGKLYVDSKVNAIKFVPASGAATRMFKFLFECMGNSFGDELSKDSDRFFKNLNSFAFYSDLEDVLQSNGKSINDFIEKKEYQEVLRYFLLSEGLDYGQKPKGVLKFHKYENQERTAVEEHLVEAAEYCFSPDGIEVHFTISKEHEDLFNDIIKSKSKDIEEKYSIKLNVTFSQQKSSTDMIAVDTKNSLFRTNEGELLFRPGGHGALIENLNDLDADIIFVKNIDNVVPDKLKGDTINYKKALAGYLLSIQERVSYYLELIDESKILQELRGEIDSFIENDLCYKSSHELSLNEIHDILNRPIRVCGMVKNEGEPGGGPFWVNQSNGICNLQIVETAQIDLTKHENNELLSIASHFNPVDLVCYVKDYKGKKFDLLKYRDLNTGFISTKSINGKEIKAQELPGLWNGAMANWNTVFIEVPISTFNPVKTVNDLLRPQHQ